MKRKPILHPDEEETTYLIIGLAERGFSLEDIATEAEVTVPAVKYRLQVFNISVKAYRNSGNSFAKEAKRQVKQTIRRNLRTK